MKKIPTWIKGILIIAALYLFVFQPIPYYMEVPGRAFGLDDMIEVDQEYGNDPGEFYITTVGIQQVTPMTALTSIMPYRDLLSEKELFGDIQDFEEYDVIQQYYMTSSSNTAIQVAFDAAGKSYDLDYNGVYVLQILEDSDFANDLKIGDTIKEVDGRKFQSSHDFMDYVSNLNVGETLEISFEREGEMYTATGDLIQLESGLPGIGIGLVDNTSLQTDPLVEIHAGGIGGPSAGLMFSLQIYNQLVEENIQGDYKIAGTGTIAPDGEVGRIGGIEKKIVAADEEEVDYFFAPHDEVPEEMLNLFPDLRSNYEAAVETAEAIDADLEVVPIQTFSDALEFLEELEPTETASTTKNGWAYSTFYTDKQVALSSDKN